MGVHREAQTKALRERDTHRHRQSQRPAEREKRQRFLERYAKQGATEKEMYSGEHGDHCKRQR